MPSGNRPRNANHSQRVTRERQATLCLSLRGRTFAWFSADALLALGPGSPLPEFLAVVCPMLECRRVERYSLSSSPQYATPLSSPQFLDLLTCEGESQPPLFAMVSVPADDKERVREMATWNWDHLTCRGGHRVHNPQRNGPGPMGKPGQTASQEPRAASGNSAEARSDLTLSRTIRSHSPSGVRR